MLADQLRSPVVWLLSAAAVLAAAFGEWKQAAAILIVLLINTVIGFFTEFRAVRSMEGLRKLGTRSSRVRRDGKLKTIPAELVVPGDIVLFESGDVVTADIRRVEEISFAMNRRSPANPFPSGRRRAASRPTPSSPSGPRCCTRARPSPAVPARAWWLRPAWRPSSG
jgi:E1-E2 ATPase